MVTSTSDHLLPTDFRASVLRSPDRLLYLRLSPTYLLQALTYLLLRPTYYLPTPTTYGRLLRLRLSPTYLVQALTLLTHSYYLPTYLPLLLTRWLPPRSH